MAGILATTPAHVLAKLLRDLGLGIASNGTLTPWQVFVSSQPDQPDKVITVFNTTGRDHGRIQWDGERQGMEGAMIRVRADKESVAWVKVNAIDQHLSRSVANRIVNLDGVNYYVQSITRTGGINSIGYDEGNKLRVFTLNVLAFIRQSEPVPTLP